MRYTFTRLTHHRGQLLGLLVATGATGSLPISKTPVRVRASFCALKLVHGSDGCETLIDRL